MPAYNQHQNTQVVWYLLILPSFKNKPGSTEAECRAGKPRVMGSNPVADKNFFLQKSFWWFILKKFKNVKMYFRKKEKEIQDFLWRS